ncbi:hypothetical protein TrLO_g15552 [Triparma laevis f. longispina]|uniref:UTP-monosaccharide-1-phosphate uridylyltransferase n=1 Tax=Triparma laevis f. longispina TaxID=1714387 RepID=A0A9W7FFG7_9STRA|nr:hypothetical protein TrLO_g15552 [Triparma laevis f. longispina]
MKFLLLPLLLLPSSSSYFLPPPSRPLSLLRGGSSSLPGYDLLESISCETSDSQKSLLSAFSNLSSSSAQKLSSQIITLNKSYPTGLLSYIQKSRQLLAASGSNPFEEYIPSVPSGLNLNYEDEKFEELEKQGLSVCGDSAIVLVAGGLGERLGYSGIKISLSPYSLALKSDNTQKTYLDLYLDYVRAVQQRTGKRMKFCIMTSGDTDELTRGLVEGVQDLEVEIVMQEKVPAIENVHGQLALQDDEILTKPHGHGDVHSLLLSSSLLQTWSSQSLKKLIFVQDTNALVSNAILPALGTNLQTSSEMTSICIPRLPEEAAGAITQLTHKTDPSKSLVINVEYNMLESLLKPIGGDISEPNSPFSPYPGNANNLIFDFPKYFDTVKGPSLGVVNEFVNPKMNSDGSFKKPTRLECMMQDFPYLIRDKASSGLCHNFANLERWLTFSPAKNDLDSGRATASKGVRETGTLASAESDGYIASINKLKATGEHEIEEGDWELLNGVYVYSGPRIYLSPTFCLLKSEVASKCLNLKISSKSSLSVEGYNVEIDGLNLDGALIINVADGASLKIKDYGVFNEGWKIKSYGEGEEVEERDAIRGYEFERVGEERIVIEEGEWVADGEGLRRV